jgi:hypothetical protein
VPHGAVPSYHRAPVRLARDGRSVQLGRASAPTIPQPVQTMRGPKDSTGVIGPAVDREHRAMVAEPAAHGERADALGAHVSQRHGTSGAWERGIKQLR